MRTCRHDPRLWELGDWCLKETAIWSADGLTGRQFRARPGSPGSPRARWHSDSVSPLGLPNALCPGLGARGRGRARGRPTFTLLKSSCVCSVYICSVRSILWAPSLHCFTSCEVAPGLGRVPAPRRPVPRPPALVTVPVRPCHGLDTRVQAPPPLGLSFPIDTGRAWAGPSEHPPRTSLCPRSGGVGAGPRLTLLMAFSARLAALYLSGWPWVLRQSVCREDTRHETHQGPFCTPRFEACTGGGYREVEAGPQRALPGQAVWVGTGSEHPARPHPFRSLVTSVQPGVGGGLRGL